MDTPLCRIAQAQQMRTKATTLLGLAPLCIALFTFAAPLASGVAEPEDPQPDTAQVRLQRLPASDLARVRITPAEQRMMMTDRANFQMDLVQSTTTRLDTSRFTVNVLHPRDSAAVNTIIGTIDRIPRADKEFFTGFQNDDGTGRAITVIVGSDSDVDAAHKALLGRFEAGIVVRKQLRDALRRRIYTLGLLIAGAAAVSAFLTAVFGSKGKLAIVIAVSALTLGTSVLGYISKDRSDSFSTVAKNIDAVKDLLAAYYKHRADHAPVPKEMIAYIEEVTMRLNAMD